LFKNYFFKKKIKNEIIQQIDKVFQTSNTRSKYVKIAKEKKIVLYDFFGNVIVFDFSTKKGLFVFIFEIKRLFFSFFFKQ